MLPANTYIRDTLKLKHSIESAFLHLGERLYNIQQGRLWEGLYNSYEECLMDLDITTSQASKWKSIYFTYVLSHKIPEKQLIEIGQRKLYAMLPVCTSKNAVSVHFERFRGLSATDIEREMKTEKVGKHQHQWFQYKMCSICKETHRIYDS